MHEDISAAAAFSPFFFYFFAGMTVLGSVGVAVLRNIVYSAFAMLFAFAGVVGIYGYLSADLLAVVQLMVYVGGILVLILFAVMLTSRISEIERSNPASHQLAGLAATAALAIVIGAAVLQHPWKSKTPSAHAPTSAMIGDAFLGPYLLPFEVAGLLLLAALLAAVVVARKEVKNDEPDGAKP